MAGNLFCKVEGITGECAEEGHTGWIDVSSYQEGLSSSGSAGFGGGAGVGTVSYQDFIITCQLEKAIPTLMKACADHTHYPTVKLHATKMGGEGKSWPYLEITLTDAIVSSVNFGGSDNMIPQVSIALNFSKIKTEYWEQTKTGGKGSSTNAEWDQKKNKAA
ncbi:MAG: type VI secretion system tube protein Hcp [Ramlibacter sp.]